MKPENPGQTEVEAAAAFRDRCCEGDLGLTLVLSHNLGLLSGAE